MTSAHLHFPVPALIAAAWLTLLAAAPLHAQYKEPQESAAAPSQDEPAAAPRPETGGLQFSVPDDWPIEKRNGAVGPIPIEEYMKLRFDRMTAQIQALETRVQNLEEANRRRDHEDTARRGLLLSAESSIPDTEKENP